MTSSRVGLRGMLVIALASCAPSAPAGTGGTTGEHMATGTSVGSVDVTGDGTPDGMGWDTNGDGRADEIDVDGDMIIDGEDNNGDGTITLWDELGEGALPPTADDVATQIVETDPDFDQALDPMHPPDSVDAATGEVTPPAQLMLGSGIEPESQGRQGSCAAFTNAALATIVRHEREGGALAMEWASPAYLYAFQVPASMSTCGQGTYIQTGLDVLVHTGAATRDELPYRSGNMPMLCEMDPTASMPDVFRIGSYESVRPFDSAHIRESLAAGSPIAFGTPLTSGFMSWAGEPAREVFDFDLASGPCTGQHCGGHAMLVVGYDDERRAFRVLNSWGPDWGDGGFFWLTYDYFDRLRSDVYGFAVTLLPGAPSTLGAPDPTNFAATLVGSPVLRVVDGTPVLTVRVSLSEPMRLASVTITDGAGGTATVMLDQWISYGNVALRLSETPAPGAGTVRLAGALRGDMAAMADVAVEVPMPAADPDGAN